MLNVEILFQMECYMKDFEENKLLYVLCIVHIKYEEYCGFVGIVL